MPTLNKSYRPRRKRGTVRRLFDTHRAHLSGRGQRACSSSTLPVAPAPALTFPAGQRSAQQSCMLAVALQAPGAAGKSCQIFRLLFQFLNFRISLTQIRSRSIRSSSLGCPRAVWVTQFLCQGGVRSLKQSPSTVEAQAMDGGTPSRSSVPQAPGRCSSTGTTPTDIPLCKIPSCSHRQGWDLPRLPPPAAPSSDPRQVRNVGRCPSRHHISSSFSGHPQQWAQWAAKLNLSLAAPLKTS